MMAHNYMLHVIVEATKKTTEQIYCRYCCDKEAWVSWVTLDFKLGSTKEQRLADLHDKNTHESFTTSFYS